jgi:hypothetical protein
MKTFKRALGATFAILLTIALASPALACDGQKKKDDDDKGDSAVQVQQDVDVLACDGEKKKKDEDDNTFKSEADVLACDGEKKKKDEDDNTFSA